MFDLLEQLDEITPAGVQGSVVRVTGMTVAVADFPAPLGSVVEIDRDSSQAICGEVVGFRDDQTIVYPLGDLRGLRRGHRVRLVRSSRRLPVGEALLGRVVDANCRAVDARPQPVLTERVHASRRPPPAMQRPRIDQPLSTGIRAIDSLVTCGKGQRLGIFAGSGVGKSVTLGMMARYTSAAVNVIALVGERGREVSEFIERDLGPAGLARSVVVVATSDEPALRRIQAAQTATAIAEYFRDAGRDVLLMMDSLTRFAMAQREIGLAAGEPPTARGYPPSVFAMLPQLLERAGRSSGGSITGFYTVLVEADDPQEPISDAVRGLLDGHIWLSRKLASQAHWPAIDVLESISRTMPDITTKQHRNAAQTIRELLAAYRDHEDLIAIGAYRRGANRKVDVAIDMLDDCQRFLRQSLEERTTLDASQAALISLHEAARSKLLS
ncbi:MAG: FliI/YscN family ATPase [Pirellulales bacterium]|nr:FliI/YscN family ATPase [Pirellulales bacterium]